MTKQQYRRERRALQAQLAEARKCADASKGVQRGAFEIAAFGALWLMAALRAEFYRGEAGAIQKARGEVLADFQSYLKRNGATA